MLLVLITFSIIINILLVSSKCTDFETLKQVHVLFRHGAKYPSNYETYPKDPYVNETWYPDGPGALTMLGKKQAYQGGVSLRTFYNDYLGDIYTPDVLYARSTDSPRTRSTLELVLAGLWPPAESQQWNTNLPWLPITYDYVDRTIDKLLGFPIDYCKEYADEYNKIVASDDVKKFLSDNDEFIQDINNSTGLNITTTLQLFYLYMGLLTEETAGKVLPDWTKQYYPQFLKLCTEFEYQIQTSSKFLVKGTGGPLVKQVINDAKSLINGTLSSDKKLFLYSAHEYNIPYVLSALKVYEGHVPNFAAHVIIELHKQNDIYGFKIFHDNQDGKGVTQLTIPGCASLCPIDQFIEILKDLIPDKDWCEDDKE